MTFLLLGGMAQAATLNIQLSVNVGKTPLEFGQTQQNVAGNTYSLDLLKFYLSEVALVQADGSELPLDGVRLLEFNKDTGTQNIEIFKSDVPAGTYKGVRFSVGIPRSLNHTDPTAQNDPLGVDSGMVWAWNPGYVFFKIEGKFLKGGAQQVFSLHLGTDPYKLQYNLADVQLQKIQLKVPESGGVVKLKLDISQIFKAGLNGEQYDLSQARYQQVHGGPVFGAAYLNLLGAFSLE
ncbi:hypothetical protein GCM10008938_11330 [Deinococcus roseus]|uniref:Copper-binding protein MbnP-like domain-containing protein n=2 Tax=Deinococcus roseus TaxID=392414 RepID=A0ABQ2CWN8_9DEIO|nr:hypothetical protein GCM10008938_11330 [Deinococcus roseus]